MKKTMAALIVAAPLAAAGAQTTPPPAAAAAKPATGRPGLFDNVVNAPGIGWGMYGAGLSGKQVPAAGTGAADVPGGQAVRFTTTVVGANPWDAAAFYATTKPVAKGDVLVAMVYMRAPKAAEGAAIPVPIGMSEAAAPYTQIANETVQVGPGWKRYFIAGAAPKGFAAGQARVTVQLAGARQIVELGAAFMLDPGPTYDTARLPRN